MSRVAGRPVIVAAVIGAAMAIATSIIPYWFPPSEPTISESYEMGFNNSVAFALYAFLLLLGGLLIRTRSPESLPRLLGGWGLWPLSSRLLLAVTLGVHALSFAALYLYKSRFFFADAIYFQTLLLRMTQGERPYLDFGAYYGPSMLYPQYWLASVFGVSAGYGIVLIGTYLAGLVMLFALLHRMIPFPRSADLWFLALAVGFASPLTTLNVTFFRFLLPTVVYFLVSDAVRARTASSAAVAGIAVAFAVTYSFEVALLSIGAVGLVLMAPLVHRTELVRTALRGGAIILLAAILSIGSLLVIDWQGTALVAYPEVALSYMSGAHNAPVYPNAPYLILIAITLFVVTTAVRGLRVSSDAAATAFASLALIALVSQRGAFGAFEVGHIVSFGLPALLLGLSRIENAPRPRARGVLFGALLLAWVIPFQYYHVSELAPALLRISSNTSVAGSSAVERTPPERSIAQLVSIVGTEWPYLMPDLEYYSLPVYQAARLRYPTYESYLETARTPAGMERLVREVREAGATVIVPSSRLAAEPIPDVNAVRYLDLIPGAMTAGWPIRPVTVVNQTRMYRPFFDFLRREYRVVATHGGLSALVPAGR